MTLSLGEVESTALRATRGAGFPWGLAEEAAVATRWLTAQGLDGLSLLLVALQAHAAGQTAAPGPGWQAGLPLCPLATGPALADHWPLIAAAPPGLGPLCAPALILPHLARAAARQGQTLRAAWPGCSVLLGADGLTVQDGTGLMAPMAPHLHLSPAPAAPRGQAPSPAADTPPDTPPDVRDRLAAFIHLTHVPASARSRQGAGAATDDD